MAGAATIDVGDQAPFDLAVDSGGVPACGVAHHAAGRGPRLLSLEHCDLASARSSFMAGRRAA